MKKSLILMLLCGMITGIAAAQQLPEGLSDEQFSTYYQQRVSHFRSLPVQPGKVIFLGNSITDGAEWNELFPSANVLNRGISGDQALGILNRLDEVTGRKPAKVFLMIGTNDLASGVPADEVLEHIFLIARLIKKDSPQTQLYVQSILPVNDAFGMFEGHTGNAAEILKINRELESRAGEYSFQYVDLHALFSDEGGRLKKEFTNDGLHLNGKAYLQWREVILPFVSDK